MTSPTTVEVDDAADWVTRAEMIRLTGTSEKTVQRDVKDNALAEKTGPRGQKMHRLSDFRRIGRLKATDIPNGLTGSQAAEVLRLQEQVARLTAERGELHGRLAEVRDARDLAVAQIAIKDAQLKTRDEQLSRLVTALSRPAQ